jgi:sugar transferase (PEP-CTERM system associated)
MGRAFHYQLMFGSVFRFVSVGVLCFFAVLLAALLQAGELMSLSVGNAATAERVARPALEFALLLTTLCAALGLYKHHNNAKFATTLRWSLSVVALAAASAFLVFGLSAEREFFAELAGSFALILLAALISFQSALALLVQKGFGVRRVLIVGTGSDAGEVISELDAVESGRYSLIGLYPTQACDQQKLFGTKVLDAGVPLTKLVLDHAIDEVIVAIRDQRGSGLPMKELLACRVAGIRVLDMPTFYERTRGEVPINSLKASWFVYGQGFAQSFSRNAVKRVFDLMASIGLLLLTWPVMLVGALAVKLESRGPVLYRQERVGQHGRSFTILKLRSMTVDAEKDGVAKWASTNDVRVTKVGKFIRKTRIDELPQLLNVIRGEMSFVGPRPERPSFVESLKQQIAYYDLRHSVKPGLTGWAQVRFSYGASLEDATKKLHFDLYYVKNHSLFLDVLILFQTVRVILRQEGSR